MQPRAQRNVFVDDAPPRFPGEDFRHTRRCRVWRNATELRLHPRLAPIKAAVFPLVAKEGMPEISERLHAEIARRFKRHGFIEHDVKATIGKRYARMDEAGCPYCFTVDGETLQDQTVTVRDRDTGHQDRIALDRVVAYLDDKLGLQ